MRASIVLLFIAIFSFANSQCANRNKYNSGGNNRGWMITPDGRNRTYIFYLPENYASQTSASPLVFMFHGGGGNGLSAEILYGFNNVSDQHNVITVYPDGFNNTWNAGGACCGTAARLQIDDILFTRLLFQNLSSELCVDTSRVYATGMSNGAVFSHRVGCEMSDIFAAIAPVEGTLQVRTCTPAYPVPIYELHGTDDQNVPFNGGPGCGVAGVNWVSVPSAIDTWASINQCNCSYTQNLTTNCGTIVQQVLDATCTSFGSCAGNNNVVLCLIQGEGHSWSGGNKPPNPDPTCNNVIGQFPATPNIWNFFANHPKSSANLPSSANVPSSANPSTVETDVGSQTSPVTANHYPIRPSAALLMVTFVLYFK